MKNHRMKRTFTTEYRAKLSAANKGRKHTAQSRANMATAQRRHYEDPAAREKVAAAQRGELNNHWAGGDVGIAGAHHRHRKAHADQPCAHADETCKGRLECAFKHDTPPEHVKVLPRSGRPYSTRAEDYQRLCSSHHKRYDRDERIER